MVLGERSFGPQMHLLGNQFKEWDREKNWAYYVSSFQFEKKNLNVPLMKCPNVENLRADEIEKEPTMGYAFG